MKMKRIGEAAMILEEMLEIYNTIFINFHFNVYINEYFL